MMRSERTLSSIHYRRSFHLLTLTVLIFLSLAVGGILIAVFPPGGLASKSHGIELAGASGTLGSLALFFKSALMPFYDRMAARNLHEIYMREREACEARLYEAVKDERVYKQLLMKNVEDARSRERESFDLVKLNYEQRSSHRKLQTPKRRRALSSLNTEKPPSTE